MHTGHENGGPSGGQDQPPEDGGNGNGEDMDIK